MTHSRGDNQLRNIDSKVLRLLTTLKTFTS